MEFLFDLALTYGAKLFDSDVAKMTLCFTIAARLHRNWVKKDTAVQFGKITQSIDHFAEKMSAGFSAHSIRLDGLEDRVENLEKPQGAA